MIIEDGYLDKEMIRKISSWFEEKGIFGTCIRCGDEDINLVEEILTSVGISGDSPQIGGRVYPMVVSICNGCGRAETFSAVAMGLYEGELRVRPDE